MSCVNINNKDFKDLQQKYSSSSGTLENAIKIWLDKKNLKTYNPKDSDFIDHLNSYFKVKSDNVYTSKKDYTEAHKLWKEGYQSHLNENGVFSVSKDQKDLVYNNAIKYFGKDNVLMYDNLEGNFTIRIAEPILKTSPQIKSNTKSYSRYDPNGYEVSTAGDKRFSALNAKFKEGTIIEGQDVGNKSIEDVYQTIIKKSGKNKSPSKDSKLYNSELKTKEDKENFSYIHGYLPLWQEWAKQNPELIQDLILKSEGKILTDKFANTKVSQARALADIINNLEDSLIPDLETSLLAEELTPFEEAAQIVDQIIEDSKKIKFNAEDHSYTIDGKKVDSSVTQYLHGNLDIGAWGVPSSVLGTTVDTIVRDFFMGNIKSSYPNMSKSDLSNILEDLAILDSHLQEKFGEDGYKVVSQEFPIAAKYTVNNNGKSEVKTMAGTMDILVYDSEGNFYIYDTKTARSGFKPNKLEGYSNQLNLYKTILEANYPKLRGKIKELKVIPFNLYYPAPVDNRNQEIHSYINDNGTLMIDGNPITTHEDYTAPRLQMSESLDALLPLDMKKLDIEMESLSKEDSDILKSELGIKKVTKPFKFVQSEDDAQRIALYNNPLLSPSDIKLLSNGIMTAVSKILSSTNTSIEEVNIGKILNNLKESFYNPNNRYDIEDFDTLDALQAAYDNWDALVKAGYAKLIELEKVTIEENTTKKVIDSDIDFDIESNNEVGALEETEREHYQLSLKNLSIKSTLSQDIRKEFSKLEVTDELGNVLRDKFGQPIYVDSDVAINSILQWTRGAENIEEMESILTELSEYILWLKPILDKIQKEPFRSLFYSNFKKQSILYSTILVDSDELGNTTRTFNMVNMKEASKVALDAIIESYKEGLMPNLITPKKGALQGEGSVNVDKVAELKAKKDKIANKLRESFSNRQIYRDTLFNSIPEIISLLDEVGIKTTKETLRPLFARDVNNRQIAYTNSHRILTEISYMLDILDKNKDNTSYNPVDKSSKDNNIYGNYKNIINIISQFEVSSIEPSVYENGKMYYGYTTPSYMSKLISSLKDVLGNKIKFDKFIEEEYGSYKWFKTADTWNNEWLRLLTVSKEARQNLEYTTQLNMDKVDYVDLSELGYIRSIIASYFYSPNTKYAWYRVPILSNKPASEFIKFKKYSGADYKDIMTKLYKNVFNQEIMRIKTVLERAINDAKSDITSFDISSKFIANNPEILKRIKNKTLTSSDYIKLVNSGASFKFLSGFNREIAENTDLGQIILDKINGKDVNEELLHDYYKDSFKGQMQNIVESERVKWENSGLFDIETHNGYSKLKYLSEHSRSYSSILKELSGPEYNHLDKKTKEEMTIKIMKDEAMTKLENFIWNDMFASINIIQLSVTDLAYYKNVEDFQKRFAQVHAPAIKVNTSARDSNGVLYSADGKSRSITIKDEIIVSDIIPNVATIFDNRIANTTNNTEKLHLKQIKDLILTSLTKINTTDGQAFSSPTSYRKKMGMLGQFDPNMELAYQRIISGNYNVDDLGILWQPLKPFVYTQTRKTAYAETMSDLKVPIQNKNSEYLLILADAIIRGDNKTSKLTAIFDFMEETAYDGRIHDKGKVVKEGNYNGIGIDTVQFESAVKSGNMGAIDIAKLSSYKAIKDTLHHATYVNSDKTGDSSNNMERYDDRFIHTFSYNDYGIQQAVPDHFVDHEQLRGSQQRILSISDITQNPNIKFSIGKESLTGTELQTEYQQLLAANIYESFDKLSKEFALEGTPIEKNIAMSKVLVKAILSDQRYGADLLRACSLDINGNFVIPLSDSIQSSRIQQLINSIIKSRINKQKTKGGPVVQATSFGLSEDLNIVWKSKTGKLLLTKDQFTEKFGANKTENQVALAYKKYINDNQGTISHFEAYAPVPSSELEVALTKPDGSRMSLDEAIKLDIIPESFRQAIGYRIPTEDKYSMIPIIIKDFLPKAAGEALMLPKEITWLSGSDFDIDKIYLIMKAHNVVRYRKDKARRDFEKLYSKDIQKGEFKITFNEWFNTLPNKEDYRLENIRFTEVRYDKDKSIESNSKDQRDNRVFDLQWSVLTNEDTLHKMFNPGSFDNLKKLARIITAIKNNSGKSLAELESMSLDELDAINVKSNDLDITKSSTQVYFHQQNMIAGKLIGIFANNNTSHAFLSMQDIYFNINPGEEFMFDGHTVSRDLNNKIDSLLGKNGSLISKVIASYLASSVDAVKDPVLNFLNLNTLTSNPAMTLIRLGFDETSVGMFLTQPSLERLTKEYFKRSNEGYVDLSALIKEEIKRLGISKELSKSLKRDLKNTPFTKADLIEGIKNPTPEFQARVLTLFERLYSMGKSLNDLTFITKFNSVSNAVGPSIADTLVLRDRYDRFIEIMQSRKPPFSQSAVNILDNSPLLKAFYDTTIGDRGAARLIFKEYFPHYSNGFEEVLSSIKNFTKAPLNAKTINSLVNDYVLFKLTSGQDPVLKGDYESRLNFISPEFISKFKEQSLGLNNDLLKIINVKSHDSKCPVPTLEAKTGGLSSNGQEKIKDAWSDLLSNPTTKQLGLDLFYYNVYRSGFEFSPKTFLHLASVNTKISIPGYVDTIRNTAFNESSINTNTFILQYLRNHASNTRLVPNIKATQGLELSTGIDILGNDILTINFTEDSYNPTVVKSNENENTFAPMVTYKKNLYQFNYNTETSVSYRKITILGNTNNFLEYDANSSSDMASVLKDSTVEPSKDDSKEPRVTSLDGINESEARWILENVFSPEESVKFSSLENSDRTDFVLKVLNKDHENLATEISEQLDTILEKLC